MASNSLRRLASDQSSLRRSPLPPNYLFPLDQDSTTLPDDLSQLTILLTGPQGTPYAQGLWRLHLKMPDDFPQSPPKASFRTRIWHPNVEESTGSVCVDTLKRDWHSKLTLRDVLITISCLLIQPNPDSALNSAAGSLLQDDYEDFARQAKLMTSIHAPIPRAMKDLVQEAKVRGEDNPTKFPGIDTRPSAPRPLSKQSVIMKKQALISSYERKQEQDVSDDEEHDPSKENNPSLSSSPVSPNPAPIRKSTLGKRPLSALPTPIDPDATKCREALSNSERNIAANSDPIDADNHDSEGPLRKSPKLAGHSQASCEADHQGNRTDESVNGSLVTDNDEEKENPGRYKEKDSLVVRPKPRNVLPTVIQNRPLPASRKTSNAVPSIGKGARVGIRRL